MDAFEWLSDLEEPLFRLLNHAGVNPLVDAVFFVFTLCGALYVLIWLAPIAWLRGRRELAFDVVVALALASVAVELLKLALARERPANVLDSVNTVSIWGLTDATGYSFPSGHAARAFAVATLISVRGKGLATYAPIPIAFLVALSRVYFGLHWPTDILAGSVLGAVASILIVRAGDRWPVYMSARGRVISTIVRLRRHPGKRAPAVEAESVAKV